LNPAIQAIIIDDDKEAIKILEALVRRYTPEVEIIATADQPVQGLEKIKNLRPQLVFLDIQMPQLSGFELLAEANKESFEVIFTSATDRFALQALKAGALDYLVKPIEVSDLKSAIEKLSAKKASPSAQQLEMLMAYFKPEKPKVRRIALTASDHLIFVDTHDIVYCESDSNYTTFFLTKGEKVVISKTLKDVEEILEGEDFFRIHASFLINMKHVSKFTRGDGGFVVMSNQQHITVSRKKKEEFFERFSKL
jgi:two-component system, LytTR family, response regulator